jgi:hypothetical protein
MWAPAIAQMEYPITDRSVCLQEEGSDAGNASPAAAYRPQQHGSSGNEAMASDKRKNQVTEKMKSLLARMGPERASLLREKILTHYSSQETSQESHITQAAIGPNEEPKRGITPQKATTPSPAPRKVPQKLGESSQEASGAAATTSASPDIEGHGKNTLARSHPTNLATGKATSNSNPTKADRGADKAVDGGDTHYATCTHASRNTAGKTVDVNNQPTSHPVNWWYVDLGEKKLVKEVHVTNTEGEEHKK